MSIDRKAAVQRWKERKPAPGIYAIRAPDGGVWLGQSPDTTGVQNRHWFTLRHGSHANRALQAAWNTHGEEAFRFEIIEALAEEDDPIILSSQLRDALRRWRQALAAPAA
ncbi:MAG: hypothetical protein CFE37_01955 [Alphaproteobacteria bacterium PA4]|nr:MAG: hypothetical protein CFE37_01955 [Alphaproteobacteria bacterium PA4]